MVADIGVVFCRERREAVMPQSKQNPVPSAQEIAEKAAEEVRRNSQVCHWAKGSFYDHNCLKIILSAITAAVAQQKTHAEAWRLVAKGKEGAYAAMEADLAHVKGELAYMKLQRDALLDITWLDLPGEPSESVAEWREQFSSGWQRKAEVAAAVAQAKVAQQDQQERIAQLIAHRACHSAEHDPQNGKLHGYCIVCGVPWPCETAKSPVVTQADQLSEDTKRMNWLEAHAQWHDPANKLKVIFPMETVTYLTLRQAIDTAIKRINT